MRRFRRMAEPSPFARAAQFASFQAGRSWAFITAVIVVLVWAITGPLFGFSTPGSW